MRRNELLCGFVPFDCVLRGAIAAAVMNEASRRYDRHAAIAMRAQCAITKYEQNIVEEIISWTEGVVPIAAYADFSHPTVEACRTGLLATAEERQDTSGYISAGRFSYFGDAVPAPN